MFINPKTAIEKGWITFPSWMSEEQKQKCIQPNAIDFTIDKLFTIESNSYAIITEEKREFRKNVEIPQSVSGNWTLLSNKLYDGMSDFYVNVPTGVAALLIIRSSFNRVGIHLNAGMYDSGYSGPIGFSLHNRSSELMTAPGTRIGQIIFIDSDSSGLYSGGFNTEQGKHWSSSVNAK